ncbi:MAG: hypothetical protein M9963_12390 [Kiritimatiellae bacterium]|nr:hypothetical protein [Kiritimatiellia bacterium]MCO5062771.1 hypothetical protein [Kiritimatiellia bacterium]MCO6399631.1 hypothetical protein [Verrucomicrobiota bacterium]
MAENLNHIMDRIRAVHRQLAERFERVETTPEQSRLRLVLDYVARYENGLDEALEEYQARAPRAMLDAVFKSMPGRPLEDCLEEVKIDPNDPDSVLHSVVAMNRCLIETLRKMSSGVLAHDAREFFDLLIQIEEREERRLVRDAVEMDDL